MIIYTIMKKCCRIFKLFFFLVYLLTGIWILLLFETVEIVLLLVALLLFVLSL